MEKSYKSTKYACYVGYITQAIINNLSPLLFVTFRRQFGIELAQLTVLISLNFIVQLIVDLIAAKLADKIGYRILITGAHFFAVAGLVLMGSLPFILPQPYTGLIISTIVSSIGGGLLEVIVSPIVEALPTGENKKASMSFLHSFYCWGSVAVVLFSTLFLKIAGGDRWVFLPLIWAVLPLINGICFIRLPLKRLNEDSGIENIPLAKLMGKKIFLILFLLMICSGASELAMSQWASFFAEAGLKVDKTMGDILGPCLFAVLMGSARLFFGIKGDKISTEKSMFFCAGLCILSYFTAAFSPWPVVSLIGCAICGLSVGVMWPGTFSLASKYFPQGGTAMFAILALAGDLGCASGPGLVGIVSSMVRRGSAAVSAGADIETAALKAGLLAAAVFPLLLAAGILMLKKAAKNKKKIIV